MNFPPDARCRNCKHFVRGGYFKHCLEALQESESVVSTFEAEGETRVIVSNTADRWGLCLHPSMQSDFVTGWMPRDVEPGADGVEATCDENRGHLSVGQDFGCIHFEPVC